MPAGGNGMDWNDEIVRRLRWLWDEGHSTAEIGRRLGVSKNAVVGKVHRLDLPTRPSPISRGGASGPAAKPNATPRAETGRDHADEVVHGVGNRTEGDDSISRHRRLDPNAGSTATNAGRKQALLLADR